MDEREQYLKLFLDEALDVLESFHSALLKLDATPGDLLAVGEAFRAAHTIKGSAANVGANQLQAGAARLETAGNWREARALIPRLNRQLEILERTMRKFTETLAP